MHSVGQSGLTVNGGIAQLAGTGGDQIIDSGSVTVISGTFDTNGRNEAFTTLSLQGTGIGNAGALVNSAAAYSAITPSGGTTLTANATIGVTQSAGELALNNAIGGNFALTKTGPGILILNAINSFSGGLIVQQGTIQTTSAINNAGTNGVLGNNTSVTLGSNGQTGTLVFNGASGSSNMPFTLATGGTGAFQVIDGDPIQLSGTIGGAGALLVTPGNTLNGGTLTLSGNNTFTGGVTIDGGQGNGGTTLQVGSAGALNASAPNVVTFTGIYPTLTLGGFSTTVAGLNSVNVPEASLATVQNASSTAASLTVNIPGAVNDSYDGFLSDGTGGGPLSLIKTGDGTLTLLETEDYTGTTTISGGTLRLGGDGVNNVGVITSTTVVDNGVLEFAIPVVPAITNYKYLYGGNISGGGSLTKSGSGTVVLSGNNSYTGTTTISGGTLEMAGGALASNVLNQATFVYNGGTFGGHLTNQGTATFNADFVAGNGMENDAIATAAAGVNLSFNGAGLDNEGTLTANGGTVTVAGAANVNRGNLNLSSLNLSGATLINNGSLVFTGGLVSGVSGSLDNAVGGTISGTANITTGFSNAGGTLLVGSGTINITSGFSNSGLIQLTAANADLVGGTIGNPAVGTIQGLGIVGNSIVNGGTVESMGGTLTLNGQLTNLTGGLLAVDAGSKMLVTQGLTANAGIINLTGGTFDNGGLALSNGVTGQISGWGIFRTGGLTNNGSITFSGGLTTVNGPVTNSSGKTITIAQNPAIFTGLVTNNSGATFETASATATFAGGFTNNGATNFVNTVGGMANIIAAPTTLNTGSALSIVSGTLSFDLVSGSPVVGSGVSVQVNSGATLQLAGTVSALSDTSNPTTNLANVVTHGTGALLVTGTNQSAGMVTGDASSNAAGATVYTGSTVVGNGGSAAQLTATQILQNTLTIGAGSTVTIAPSGAGMSAVAASDAPVRERPGASRRFLRQQHGFQRSVRCDSSRDSVQRNQQHGGRASGKPPRGDRAFGGDRSWHRCEPLGKPDSGSDPVVVGVTFHGHGADGI